MYPEKYNSRPVTVQKNKKNQNNIQNINQPVNCKNY